MIRRILMGALASAVLIAAPAAAQTAQLKVGYINSQRILEQAPGARQASAQFDQELQSMRATLQPMADEIDEMIAQFEAQQLTLSEQARNQRRQAITQRQAELEQRAQQLEMQAEQRRSALVQPVMDRIYRVIEEIRVDGNYQIIFDVAAGSVIAADPDLDLTEEVVSRLQNAADGGPGGGD